VARTCQLERVLLTWSLHLTRGRLRGDIGINFLIGLPSVTGIFLVEADDFAVDLGPGGDIQRLLQLVIDLAHFDFAVQALDLHAFHRERHFDRICRLCFLDRLAQHFDDGIGRHGIKIVIVFFLVGFDDFLAGKRFIVRRPVPNRFHVLGAGGTHCGRHAGRGGIVGVKIGFQVRVFGSLDQ